MPRPKTLPAFTDQEREKAHMLLAARVAYMMGRKMEEADWAYAYCRAKGITERGWSNLNIDVMHGNLGVEHKMICYRSNADLSEAYGQTIMHPAATRSIRVPSVDSDPNEAMRDILQQYAAVIEQRRGKVRQQCPPGTEPDMRTGWLLWQESLRQFLYFEEEMLPPNPEEFSAEWKKSGGGARKESTNLWVYETATGRKRYSITTSAGAKVQPYFDVPTPSDPNVYLFTVIGEVIGTDHVRVWLSEATAREIRAFVGDLSVEHISEAIVRTLTGQTPIEQAVLTGDDPAESVVITTEAYGLLKAVMPGVNDDHSFQLWAKSQRAAAKGGTA